MPFKSKKQELWMRINKPSMYKRWKSKYGSYSNNLKKKRRRSKKRSRRS